ncbi:MAG: saccharopine dehydrogenase-like oxidoreductase [Cyanobacteria bacterium P01_A01_bin.3]
MRLAIYGSGGLGRSMLTLVQYKRDIQAVAILDRSGYAFEANGIAPFKDDFSGCAILPGGVLCERAIDQLLLDRGKEIDTIFLALPNLPNDFLPSVIDRIIATGYKGVIADALKRTSAMELILERSDALKAAGITHVTGAGATPGLLTAAAALAAQSYVDILSVTIEFGVGIDNWDRYRGTIREDIGHMDGFDIAMAQSLSDDEIDAILDKSNGLMHLTNMEHADDLMLEMAGICPRDRVTVGGVIDTRNPRKPLQTTMILTGMTFEGKRSSHTFTFGNETSMAANVNGPVLGYLQSAHWLHSHNIFGCFTAAQIMPQFNPGAPSALNQLQSLAHARTTA